MTYAVTKGHHSFDKPSTVIMTAVVTNPTCDNFLAIRLTVV